MEGREPGSGFNQNAAHECVKFSVTEAATGMRMGMSFLPWTLPPLAPALSLTLLQSDHRLQGEISGGWHKTSSPQPIVELDT